MLRFGLWVGVETEIGLGSGSGSGRHTDTQTRMHAHEHTRTRTHPADLLEVIRYTEENGHGGEATRETVARI